VSLLLLVEFPDDPPLAAVSVSEPVPVVVEVAPPLEALLLNVELPEEPALPDGASAEADAVVPFAAEVLLLVLDLLAEALASAAADFEALASSEAFAEWEFVDEYDLSEFLDADSLAEAVHALLSLASRVVLYVEFELFERVLFRVLSTVRLESWLEDLSSDVSRLELLVYVLVESDADETDSCEFLPRV